jgi:predicted phosphodiesterase
MRLAVFSDIHGNLTAFDAAWRDYQAQGSADQVWFLGDYAMIGARPHETALRVKAILDHANADDATKGTVKAISGNTDRYLVTGARHAQKPCETAEAFAERMPQILAHEARIIWGLQQLTFESYEFLAKLRTEISLTAPAYGHVIGYHAVPGNDEGYLLPDTDDEQAMDHLLDREGRLGIGGHIHIQMDRTLPNGWRVINVGSVGLTFEAGKGGYAQYGMFTFDDAGGVQIDLRNIPYDVDAELDAARAVGYPTVDWLEGKLRGTA